MKNLLIALIAVVVCGTTAMANNNVPQAEILFIQYVKKDEKNKQLIQNQMP